MKICVYGVARSGSTSLFKLILGHFPEFENWDEPFNKFSNKDWETKDINFIQEIDNKTNLIIKTLHYQKTDEYNEEQFLKILLKKFDVIIFLIRENILEQSESYLYRKKTNPYDWHTPEKYDMGLISHTDIRDSIFDFSLANHFIINNCIKNNLKYYTYEDIFLKYNINSINEIFCQLGIQLNSELYKEWILDNSKKERLI